jgi:hypothetical protein
MGLIDRFSSPMTPARQVICSSGWQESLIGGARRIVRRLRPKNNFAKAIQLDSETLSKKDCKRNARFHP